MADTDSVLPPCGCLFVMLLSDSLQLSPLSDYPPELSSTVYSAQVLAASVSLSPVEQFHHEN